MTHDDYEKEEPVPGLPAVPPEGEQILWQGSPHWGTLLMQVFKLHWIVAYFVVLIGYRIAGGSGQSAVAVLDTALPSLVLSIAAIAVLVLIAWAIARTTIYTITSRRVVMRFGVALRVTYNIPFKAIAAANVRRHRGGTGNIAIALTHGERIAYLALWPHARPWRFKTPEPMLRALPDVETASATLAEALSTYHEKLRVHRSGVSDDRSAQASRPVRLPRLLLDAAE
jgi:hypothetical protein